MIKVSVIVPVYNTELYIAKTIQSLVLQTMKDFEVILVNDKTEDNAIPIAEHILRQNNIRFTTINQEKNEGLGSSRNKGVKLAKGAWLMYLDSDDILHSDALEILLSAAERNEAEIAFCNFQRVKPGQEFKAANRSSKEKKFDKILLQECFLTRKDIVLVSGSLFNKNWYLKNDFKFTEIPFSEDQLFIWELLRFMQKGVKVECILYNYLQRPRSLMTNSKYGNIITGLSYYEEMQQAYSKTENAFVAYYLLSRWVFGIMRASANLCTFKEYRKLYQGFEAAKHYGILSQFPDKKIRFFSYFSKKSSLLAFLLNKISHPVAYAGR